MFRQIAIAAAFAAAWASAVHSETYELHIDADYSINSAAAESIELGFRTALSEVAYTIGDIEIEVVPKDNRGNVKRSHHSMEQYLENPNALALIGGIHSPPYLTHKDFINENGILTLLPWSAAGPITRSQSAENWIFRLSVDDYKSGSFFVREAVEKRNCKSVSLILLDTGWGRANRKSLTAALAKKGMKPTSVEYFPASIRSSTATAIAKRIGATSTDCAVMLANWTNGAIVVNALAEETNGLRLFSHWGIMGGEFADRVSHDTRESLQLSLLQTCALEREQMGSEVLSNALSEAGYGQKSITEVPAQTGFVHGYDLARVFIAATRQAMETDAWNDGIESKRRAIREALESLALPVEGILNTYNPPFESYSDDDIDAHEALGLNDLCLAKFRADGLLENAN